MEEEIRSPRRYVYVGDDEEREQARKKKQCMGVRKEKNEGRKVPCFRENNHKLFISHNSITDLISQIAVRMAHTVPS